jgi:transposase
LQGSLANFLSPTTEVGWLVLGLRPAVENEAASETMRLLSEGRGDPVAERTRALNRLHALLRDLLLPGRVVSGKLWAERAARILRSIRPKGASARLRRQPASEVLRLE